MNAYQEFPDTSKVWIYQADRPFREEDIPVIKQKVSDFVQNWISHNNRLRAAGDVLHGRLVVLMVDESRAGASGCSIDKSVYFLKSLQAEYGVDLFNRMFFTFLNDGKPETVSRDEFERLYREGKIDDNTQVFDTLVNNKKDFDQGLVKSLGESWHKRLV